MARTKQQPAKGGKQAVARNSAKRQATPAEVQSRRQRLQGVQIDYEIKRRKHELKWGDQRFTLSEIVTGVALTGLFFSIIYGGAFIAYLIAG